METGPSYLITKYRLQDIEKAREERDRLRAECWDAFIKRAGGSLLVMVNPPR